MSLWRCCYCQTMYSEGDLPARSHKPEFKPECYEDVEEIDPLMMLARARMYLFSIGAVGRLETDTILLAAWRKVHDRK